MFKVCGLLGPMMILALFTSGCAEQHEESPQKETKTGYKFRKVSQEQLKSLGVKDPKKFGESWEDPSGAVWSGIAKHDNGSLKTDDHVEAERYCTSLGAELPSGWPEDFNGKQGFPNHDSDFVRLRKYMGAEYAARYDTPKRYTAQILPDLLHWHWSSSVHPDFTTYAYGFNGAYGDVDLGFRKTDINYYSYRCVVPTTARR